MKNITIIILFLAFGTLLTAQEVSTPKNNLRINFNPDIGKEFHITPTQTFSANLNLAPQFTHTLGGRNRHEPISYLTALNAEYRFYLDRQKQIDKGAGIHHHSGFYLAPRVRYSADLIKIGGKFPRLLIYDAEFALSGVIGYQKTFNADFRVGFNVGMDLRFDDFGISPTFIGSPNLSYAIPRKNRR